MVSRDKRKLDGETVLDLSDHRGKSSMHQQRREEANTEREGQESAGAIDHRHDDQETLFYWLSCCAPAS
jgi:hypothetical protein